MKFTIVSILVPCCFIFLITCLASGKNFNLEKIENFKIEIDENVKCNEVLKENSATSNRDKYLIGVCLYNQNKRIDGINHIHKSCNEGYGMACKTINEIYSYEDYLFNNAVSFYKNNEIVKSRKILEYLKMSGKHLDDSIRILDGLIYLREENYLEAKATVEPIRSRIEKAFKKVQENPDTFGDHDREIMEFFYDNMNIVLGVSNFFLNNFVEAKYYFENYKDIKNDQTVYAMKGVSEYKTGNLENAIEIYKDLYLKGENITHKQEAAYNIACIYAEKSDCNNAIFWLEKVFDLGNEDYWLNYLKSDEDFDGLRKNNGFLNYLKTQENRSHENGVPSP
jgi:tetratricopeptide (TPR) repeat protein